MKGETGPDRGFLSTSGDRSTAGSRSTNGDHDARESSDRPLAEQLDRLVDGELSESEYRELLELLEATPEGWRRCATAFLEAQALERDLGSVWGRSERGHGGEREHMASGSASGLTAIADDSSSSVRSPRSSALRWLAIAASWAVVFAAGWGVSVVGKQGANLPGAASPIAEVPGASGVGSVESLAGSTPSNESEFGVDPATGMATNELPVDQAGVPVWSPFPIDPRLVHTEERQLPRNVIDRWRERGRDLRVREHFIPVRTQDGQGMIVPVREINVAPVRNVAY
jgi:hypothetical protein